MLNVKTLVKDSILTITVDLSKTHGPSKSRKTTIVASTQGNVPVGDGAVLGLNVYRPK